MTSRSSKQDANESNVFFMVLIAICSWSVKSLGRHQQLTIVPRRATFDPLPLTRARATLPKLPSPISLITSNRSSKAILACDMGRWCVSVAIAIFLIFCRASFKSSKDLWQFPDLVETEFSEFVEKLVWICYILVIVVLSIRVLLSSGRWRSVQYCRVLVIERETRSESCIANVVKEMQLRSPRSDEMRSTCTSKLPSTMDLYSS